MTSFATVATSFFTFYAIFMEQHAVPRNITGFQFRLVGDMTLKQFGYLAGGALIAYIIYKIAPFPQIVNVMLAGSVGLAGVAFAFLPIQERPLDRWLVAFVKSITSPTQFVWRKGNSPPEILIKPLLTHAVSSQPTSMQVRNKEAREKLKAYLATLPSLPHETLNVQERKSIENTMALFHLSQVVVSPTPHIISSTPQTYPPSINQVKPAAATPLPPQPVTTPQPALQTAFPQAKPQQPANPPAPPTPTTHAPTIQPTIEAQNLQRQLSRLASEKQTLEKELDNLKQMFTKMQQSEVVNLSPTKETVEPTIKMVSSKTAVSEMGIPNLPQTANVILGVIQDPQKRLLPNIIITIKDKNGLPLRALKTNKLGRFEIATPLPNGTYLLEIEDPMKRFVFDIAQITLSGKVLPPIEIIAKGEKELMREKLTKELFGNTI